MIRQNIGRFLNERAVTYLRFLVVFTTRDYIILAVSEDLDNAFKHKGRGP